MSGIGAGHNKFETCKDCQDRCIDPNCHDSCEGYKYRQKKVAEAKQRKKEHYAGCMTESVYKRTSKKTGRKMINRKEIERLIAMELEDANKKHHPLFASDHEAYAVIKEEIEETEHELEAIRSFLKSLWWSIKHDKTDTERSYKQMKEASVRLIQESIQVAAMCDKAIKSK